MVAWLAWMYRGGQGGGRETSNVRGCRRHLNFTRGFSPGPTALHNDLTRYVPALGGFLHNDIMPVALPEDLGPKMRALSSDMQRRFAYAMACGGLTQSEAAREAGYSDHLGADRVAGHTLMHNAKVLDAIEEASLLVLRSLGPIAVQAAKAILENPKHKAHARIIETVLDRTGYAAKTEHTVHVNHSIDTTELEALARRLALENGIAPERFIGVNGLDAKPMKTIEHQSSDVPRETNTSEDGAK